MNISRLLPVDDVLASSSQNVVCAVCASSLGDEVVKAARLLSRLKMCLKSRAI